MADRSSSTPSAAVFAGPPGLRLAHWRRPRWFDLAFISWPFLSRISPFRRGALAAVALFELWEANRLWQSGLLDHNWVALGLGFIVLLLLLGYELGEHAAMRRDSELGREIAEWLLPHAPLAIPGCRLAFGSRRADAVGCDYFNAYPLPSPNGSRHRVFLVMADVAGKGMQAALLMATFQAGLRALVDSGVSLGELSAQMNRWCWNRSIEGKHFTMAFFGDFNPEDGELLYVSAGHQPPGLRHTDGTIERLERGGFPLGILADSSYGVGTARLEPGAALLIFSDGVVEAMDRREELFGEDRVLHELDLAGNDPADRVLDRIRSSVLSFAGLAPQPDDISFLVLTRDH